MPKSYKEMKRRIAKSKEKSILAPSMASLTGGRPVPLMKKGLAQGIYNLGKRRPAKKPIGKKVPTPTPPLEFEVTGEVDDEAIKRYAKESKRR